MSRFSQALTRFHQAIQRAIHFFSYHLNSRKVTAVSQVAGFRLVVPPTVFHPRYFLTSEFFANFVGSLDLSGKQVADVGTGTGIAALAAARAGATSVLAFDLNPHAARSAVDNASANGFGNRVTGVCCDLLSAVAPKPIFDVIVANPPDLPDQPIDLADRGFCAGPGCIDIAPLFEQARERLAPGGSIYVLLALDSPLMRFIEPARLTTRLVQTRSHLVEAVGIYELQPSPIAVSAA
jgi:methylase of polypeptide subunit release factors